jgi:uncharacterized protein (UPF0335 family)
MKTRLEVQVATAVGAMLVGREAITLGEVADSLPAHIRAAGPSLKCMARALTGAGWVGERRDGGTVVYVPAPEDDGDDGDASAAAGHNSGETIEGVAADEVRLLIERIERLDEERKGIGDDIKDVFAEAKSRGYDPTALRGILRIRAKPREQQQEETAILEVYMRALGMM